MDPTTEADPPVPTSFTLGGRTYPFKIPASFAEREELVAAWVKHRGSGDYRSVRATYALLGAVSRLGRQANTSLQACGWDVLAFGGAVYDMIRAAGPANAAEAVTAALAVYEALLVTLAPRQSEVAAAEGFSGRPEAPSTSGPSSSG